MDTATFGKMPDVAWLAKMLPRATIAARSNSPRDPGPIVCPRRGDRRPAACLGDATPGIERIDLGEEPPTRDNWLGYHRDLKRLPRLRALADLLIERSHAW